MRSLIFLLLFSGVEVFATTNTVSTQLDVQSVQQPLGIAGVSSSPTTQNIRSTIGLTTDQIGHGLTLDAKMIIDKADYSSLALRDRNNLETKLLDAPTSEFQTDMKLNWSKGQHYVSAGYFGHMSQSPFEIHGGQFQYEEGFFEKTTLVGIDASAFEQKRPLDFFVDRDSLLKQRPSVVHASEIGSSVEQVFTERWKARARVSTSKKMEERPRNWGFEIKNAYAFNSKLFAALSGGYFQESTNDPLLNERGYFTALVSQLEVSIEPIYDFWVSVSYGVSLERESDPRISTTTQVGTDQYGLGFKYNYKKMAFLFQMAATSSNSLTSSSKFSGGVSWDL